MNAVCVVLVLIGSVQSIQYDVGLEGEWKSFKEMHGKSYAGDSEELLRRKIFADNKKLIDTHNARYEAGEETYKIGVNEFTDLLPSEFVSRMLGGSLNSTAVSADHIYAPSANLKIPESMDWRTSGAVSPVKNQGTCRCCWAFATVGTLEGQSFLRTKKMVEFSEQNLLDCSSQAPYRNAGCNSGTPHEALRYVKDNHGIDTRSSYAYEGHQGTCRFRKQYVGVTIRGIATVRFGDERALQAAVAEKGPIAVTIDAQHLQYYHSGIYNRACGGTAHYHVILLVGYGKDRGHDYWLLKNSWGNWGEGGYFRMARNSRNLCYIANWPVYPLI
ncbi:procathepsin L-like [Drosophila montana]|uniref:procathepsin L-like n=1 Tax=Drosophila montana TaxID=40370 RepID=UPI00313BD4FC